MHSIACSLGEKVDDLERLERIRKQTRERVRRYRERQKALQGVTSQEVLMDTVYKTYRAEIRGMDNEGILDMFIPVSTQSMDRDGEVVEPSAFKKTIPKFMKHPVLVAAHDYRDLTNQIGEWAKLRITEEGIEGKPKYYVNAGNEQADWAYYLASKGVAAFSIGFIPKEWEDGDGQKSPKRTYKDVELLEISQVIIPSNREAIQNIRSKSIDPVVHEICDEVERELITKPEEIEEYIRIPVRDCQVTATIDISEKEGIKALYCGREKKVRTYLFRKDKGWTMEKAQAWVKEHDGKGIEDLLSLGIEIKDDNLEHQKSKTSQQEILDELDYVSKLLQDNKLSEDVRGNTWDLVREIMRLSGSDIPVDIKEMFVEKKEEPKLELSMEKVQEIISREIAKAIRKAQGALD